MAAVANPICPPAPVDRRGRRPWWTLALTGVLIAGAVALDQARLGLIVALFVLVVPFEKLFPRHRQPVRRPMLGTDLAYALTAGPLGVIGIVVGVAVALLSFAWLPGLLLRPFVLALPPGVNLVVGFVLFELAVYWAHRFAHEVPFLWRFHKIHHSTEHLDWISGVRQHPLDGMIAAPPFVLLIAAGFTPQVSGALVVVQVLSGLFLHANVRWRLRPLRAIVATPEFHHWHHANESESIHTNYSGLLPIWDVVFGTFRVPADRRPSVYGIDEELPPNMVGQLLQPMRGLRRPGTVVRHPFRALRETGAAVRRGLGQMMRSATRPTRRYVVTSDPC